MSKNHSKKHDAKPESQPAAEAVPPANAEPMVDTRGDAGNAESLLRPDPEGVTLEQAADSVDAELFGDAPVEVPPSVPAEQPAPAAAAAVPEALPSVLDAAPVAPSDGKPVSLGEESELTVKDAPPELSDTRPPFEAPDLTEEQWGKLRVASDAMIELALLEDDAMPPKWRAAFVSEQDRRKALVEAAAKAAAAESAEPTMYRVSKGCHMSHEGMLTQVAAGTVVSRATHDLENLVRHGAELTPIGGSEFTTKVDQFGRPVTIVR